MRKLRAWWWVGLLACAGAPVRADASGPLRIEEAEVTASDGGALLYREAHYVEPAPRAGRLVVYRCPDGRPFARKRVQGGGAAPDFLMEDGRDGYREGVRSNGRAREAFVTSRGRTRTSPLVVSEGAVIDAGFDAAVRNRWEALAGGRAVRLQFLVPSRQRFFPVEVRRAGPVQWQGVRAERLRMRLDTWFGFAVPEVELVYARDGGRLLEFRGTGNVRDARGEHPQVRIAFAKPARSAPASELASAQRLPLDGRCSF